MTLRKQIVIPTHYLADVRAFAMETWFAKHCPRREELLEVVSRFYAALISIKVEGASDNIREADSGALETLANMIGYCVKSDPSLAEYIDKQETLTLPSDELRWYAICCAAAWLIIQVYVRELVRSQDGGK
ncbi:hypothetical protein [Mycobacterium avium]